MTLADILIGLGTLLILFAVCLVCIEIFERVRAARWRRIREPRTHGTESDNCGDQGGHPKPVGTRRSVLADETERRASK